MGLLILLPILAFGSLFLLLWAGSARGPSSSLGDWKDSFLRAAVLWGGCVAIVSETLSLVRGLHRTGLALSWAAILVVLVWVVRRRGVVGDLLVRFKRTPIQIPVGEALLLAGMVVTLVLLLVVAWLSPPNNIDSLLYHMSRVVHWAQNQSLQHYPAGMEHQLTKPIWAETAILNLRVLWGNDRPAGLVQWFGFVGALIGASAIAGALGGKRMAQWLAALFVMAIPMAVLQATSTQNDLVVSFWMVTLAYFVIRSRSGQRATTETAFVGLSAGLGILTKGPAFVYSFPLLVWFVLPRQGRRAPRWIVEVATVGLLVGILNVGFWTRNVLAFGGPYGTSDWLAANVPLTGVLGEPGARRVDGKPPEGPVGGAVGPAADAGPGTPTPEPEEALPEPGALAGSASRFFQAGVAALRELPHEITLMVAYNLVTPLHVPNAYLFRAMELLPGVIYPHEVEVIRGLPWNHEDTAGAPLHIVATFFALAGGWFLRPAGRWRLLLGYSVAVLATYLLDPIVIGHGASVWGIRYQLPFFVLGSVVPGVVLGEILPVRGARAAGVVLVLLALPWVLLNRSRPLVGEVPKITTTESVLTGDRAELLLANYDNETQNNYAQAAEAAKGLGCRALGLRLAQEYAEYPFWWLLDAPQSGIRIESLYHSSHTERYVDPAFEPCVVICSDCGDGSNDPGYALVGQYGGLSVFKVDR